jgi:hypothetical protein
MRPAIDVRIHDAHLGIWQDNANDPTFRGEVFAPLLKAMARRGWKLRADPHILKRYRSLSPSHRIASRGDLRAAIEITGRVVKVEFWAETWPIENPNGRRYDFNKLQRMVYLDRLRVRLEMRRIVAWLASIAPVTVKADEPAGLTPLQRIECRYAESWHTDKTLGRPRCDYDYNRKSGDGQLLEHGSTIWFADRKGYIDRGTTYYNINNMWWVVAGSELLNLSSREIFCQPPADLRTKLNSRQRRERLEAELAKAVRRMDFRRAETLKRIAFWEQPTFLIWARDHSAYYRPNYCGYTTDTISAGRYSRAEAEAEVRRVPHELEAIGADGERIRFERAA